MSSSKRMLRVSGSKPSAVTVRLQKPMALKENLRFAMREGGLTVGSGIVTRILG